MFYGVDSSTGKLIQNYGESKSDTMINLSLRFYFGFKINVFLNLNLTCCPK